MIKTLMGSIRDYKRAAIATPIIVSGEVVMEVAIPFVTAQLIDAIQKGATVSEMLPYAGILLKKNEDLTAVKNAKNRVRNGYRW